MSRPGEPSEEPLGGVSPERPDAAESGVDDASPEIPLGGASPDRSDAESGADGTSDDNAGPGGFALGFEREADPADDLIRTWDEALGRRLQAYAISKVGENDAKEALNRMWERIWLRHDRVYGRLNPLLFRILHDECVNIIRRRPAKERLLGDVTIEDVSSLEVPARAVPGQSEVEEEVEAKFAETLIDAGCELLSSPKYRAILRYECSMEQPRRPAIPLSVAERQQRLRMRAVVRKLAGVTTEEREAVEAVNHHRAGDPPLSKDVRALARSGELKVLAFFGIETGDDLK